MHLKMKALVLIWTAVFVGTMAAQTSPDVAESNRIYVTTSGPGLKPKTGMIGLHLETMMDAAPVKGVPFCATITTEHTQVFADGNRIHSTDDSTLCRDSAGRTRREAGLNLLGAMPQRVEWEALRPMPWRAGHPTSFFIKRSIRIQVNLHLLPKVLAIRRSTAFMLPVRA